jgi:hypothetical protein
MAPGGKDQDTRYDHGEWVILEGEEHAVSERGGRHETGPRRTGLGSLTALVLIIAILLAIMAFTSLTMPLLAQRPWVGLGGHEEILKGLAAGQAMRVRIVLRNSGQSPASSLRVVVKLLVGVPPPTPPPPVPECGPAQVGLPQTVLFPGTDWSKTVETQQNIDNDTVAAVLRNEKTVYLVGCAIYDDGLWWWHAQPRHTRFCRTLVPDSVGNYGVLGRFEDCSTGNSAD